jgi:hypothetical protein
MGVSPASAPFAGGSGALNMGVSPASAPFAAETSSAAWSPHEVSSLLSSNKELSGANMLQQPISPIEEAGAGPMYRPGAFQPITAALPKQVSNEQAPDLTPYASVSDMNPFSFAAFNPPQDIPRSTPPEQWSGTPMPENLASTREINSSTVTPLPNMPLSTATTRLSVQPPDIAEDPMLQEVMRQAQLGLFILSDT